MQGLKSRNERESDGEEEEDVESFDGDNDEDDFKIDSHASNSAHSSTIDFIVCITFFIVAIFISSSSSSRSCHEVIYQRRLIFRLCFLSPLFFCTYERNLFK